MKKNPPGWVKVWRKSVDSAIFGHAGMWKLFSLCQFLVNYEEAEVTLPGILRPIKLYPGQFVTGRYSLHFDYHQGHLKKRYSRKAAPTAYSLWRWLLIMEEMQILSIKSYNKYSIITVLNWHLYQENDHQAIIRRSSSEHREEEYKKKEEETPDFFSLRERYSDQDLIDQVCKAIASTRKSGKVADSVLLAQLQKWERYPVERVESGIKIYLDKNCAGQGKREAYLLGIIRNQKAETPKQESTGSPLLDSYYANASN